MNMVIVGQGAMGLLCYHRLSHIKHHHANNNNESQHSVSLLPSTTNAPSHYTFHEMNEQGENFPLNIADEKALTNAHVIIICVKSYQVANAVQDIAHLINKRAIIILAHNGLGPFEEIKHQLKPTHCLLALLLTQGAKKIANYHIKHTGMGDSDLGLIFGEISTETQCELLDYLQRGLTQIYWQKSIKQAQWRKLAINCVINPITALNNIENGDINSSVHQVKIRKVIQEIVTIAAKQGVILVEESLVELVHIVAENTAANTSSMRADILAKRRTEIDYINGYVHRLGEKQQLATPVNTQLWLAVKTLESNFKILKKIK